jgi:hypothetical protein
VVELGVVELALGGEAELQWEELVEALVEHSGNQEADNREVEEDLVLDMADIGLATPPERRIRGNCISVWRAIRWEVWRVYLLSRRNIRTAR